MLISYEQIIIVLRKRFQTPRKKNTTLLILKNFFKAITDIII